MNNWTVFLNIRKWIKQISLTLLLILFSYLLSACLLGLLSTSPEPIECTSSETIYLNTNGVHLDVVLHRDQIEKIYLDQIKDLEGFEYLAFGWGDKGFYLETPTWAELKLSTACKAMLWKSPTAIHITKYRRKRDDFVAVELCEQQLMQLKHFIISSFKKDSNGLFIEIPDAGYTTRDYFYEAKGSYNAIRTCNQWVNNALKAAQVKTAIWSPADYGVLYHVR